MMNSQQLILVNENDEEVGFGEKMAIHQDASLHRAFSIFVLNGEGELLLQKRALDKYHSGGLWTNTCCSHPVRDEAQEVTVHRRLREEMGFDCELENIFKFIYRAKLDKDLYEYEFDHVYLGRFDGVPTPDPEEVCDWRWMALEDLRDDLKASPHRYTYWLNHAFEQFYEICKDREAGLRNTATYQ